MTTRASGGHERLLVPLVVGVILAVGVAFVAVSVLPRLTHVQSSLSTHLKSR